MTRTRVVCTTFPFIGLPLRQALDRIGELGFALAELAVHYVPEWGHLTPGGIQRDPLAALEAVEDAQKRSGVRIVAFSVDTDPFALAERGEFDAVCKLARRAGVGILSMAGGNRDELLEVRRLKDFHGLAADHGLLLGLETRSGTRFGDPAVTADFVDSVHGLKVTLDTGHLLSGGHGPDDWGPILPLVGHVHVKDAGADAGHYQVPFGTGLLDLPRMLKELAWMRYGGLFTVEYIGRRPQDAVAFDPEPELRKAREALERALAAEG